MFSRYLIVRLFVFLLLPVIAAAQVTGRLSGSVTDPSGAPIPGATVNVYLPAGTTPVHTASTSTEGIFSFGSVRAADYDLAVEAAGFARMMLRGIKVDPSRETSVGMLKLEVKSVQQTVEVSALAESVQTANNEISTTVTAGQVRSLPVLDRQISNLFLTQPGVTYGRGAATINGLRTSATNLTYEGINVQDNFIRLNSLSYIPSKFTIEQVAEVTVTTSHANTAVGGGAAQVVQVAPSGSNSFHGNVYWYNRNNALAANDWFNNRDGVESPFLNQNQAGASLGGRIIPDKLLFYFNYEAFRNRQQVRQTRTILTPNARQGIFKYNGGAQQVNVLQSRGIQIDSFMKDLLAKVPAAGNTSDAGDGINTTGYSFNQRSNEDRNAITFKMDYILSPRHALSGTFRWDTDKVDRPDIDNTYNVVPAVFNDNRNKLVSAAWRWTAKPTLTNEVRGGFYLAPSSFAVNEKYGKFMLGDASLISVPVALYINNPYNTFLAQGRNTNTYSLQDNANWVKGRHNIFFGFQMQQVRAEPYNDAGMVPLFTLGLSGRNTTGFSQKEAPGIGSAELNDLNGLYTLLGGIVSEYRQTFNITGRNSGYVNGASNRRNFSYGTIAGYFQDNFKLLPRLTLNLGVRYDYYTRLTERDSLTLLPRLIDNNHVTTLLSNATLDFAGNSAGRPYYSKDLNNFAPNAGFAWDVFGNGKTAVRGGYSIAYINDDLITSIRANAIQAAGLATQAADTNVVGSLGAPPTVPTPVFAVPRTMKDNYALSASTNFALPDPNLRTPYVQQWSFGVEQEVQGAVVSLRYVGNHGTKLLRNIDYNQIDIGRYGFLEDFKRARNNGFLAEKATRVFNPAYDSSIPGSQPLTVFPLLPNGGMLTNATVIRNLRQGEAGTLASFYHTSRANGSLSFFPNPTTLSAFSVGNFSNSTYNSLQFDVRRPMKRGVSVQFNYVLSKVLSDGAGDDQRRLDQAIDNNNLRLERSRAPFDLTHVFKGNWNVELPFGANRRIHGGPLVNRIIGGWTVSGIWTYHSGTPFSILSARGTFNRTQALPAAQNTANTNLTKDGLDQVLGFFMTGNGPMFVSPTVIGRDGRGVASDGAAPFAGQAFFNPGPGEIGALQRRWFSGPWNMQLDAGVQKRIRISERHALELRMEALNALNHAAFFVGNESTNSSAFNINNPTFGKITQLANIANNSMRIVQFGAYYKF